MPVSSGILFFNSMAKFTLTELLELTSAEGGRFAVGNADAAVEFCRRLATSHYENFPVGSLLVGKARRKHFYTIYSFARIADDIADEFTDDPVTRLEALERMAAMLELPEGAPVTNPVFLALAVTVKDNFIPVATLKKLLTAFTDDINFVQPHDYDGLESYCSNSANPVGELILRLYSLYNEETAPLSDAVCTGLQLVNFWQDLTRDIPVGRMYIPVSLMEKYSLTQDELKAPDITNPALSALLEELCEKTAGYFTFGRGLLRYLKPLSLRLEIALTIRGGMMVLDMVKRLGTAVFTKRPKLRKIDYIKLFIFAVIDGCNIENRAGKLRKG